MLFSQFMTTLFPNPKTHLSYARFVNIPCYTSINDRVMLLIPQFAYFKSQDLQHDPFIAPLLKRAI